jgi:hypothetical protein
VFPCLAKPVPGVIEIVVDSMNDTMDVGCIRGRHFLDNSMCLGHVAGGQEKETSRTAGLWTGLAGDLVVFHPGHQSN